MITLATVSRDHRFDDIVIHDDGTTVTIIDAPPYTRIPLHRIGHPRFTIDEQGVNVAGQVWYRPIDLTPDGMTLICQRIADRRPTSIPPPGREPTHVDIYITT